MSYSPRNRRCAVLLPLGLLILAMAVFGWGLQYKLSLYQGKGSISHLTPVAKLLSQKERPPAGQALDLPTELPTWPYVLTVALAFGLFPSAVRYLQSANLEVGRPPLPICLQAVFLRPPPTSYFPR